MSVSLFTITPVSATEAEKSARAITSVDFRAVVDATVYANANLTSSLYTVTKGTGLNGNTSNWSYSNGSIYVSRNGVSGYIAKKKIVPLNKLKIVVTSDYLYTGANGQDRAYPSKIPVGTYCCYMGQSTIGSTLWFYLRVYIGNTSVYYGWMKATNAP